MKSIIIVSLMIALYGGTLPAHADVTKLDFNLVTAPAQIVRVDTNEAIYLKARVSELEAEVKLLKTSKQNKTFGLAYIDDNGNLKLKAEDGGGEWSWDGKGWYRVGASFVQPALFQQNCPNGKCPLPK